MRDKLKSRVQDLLMGGVGGVGVHRSVSAAGGRLLRRLWGRNSPPPQVQVVSDR